MKHLTISMALLGLWMFAQPLAAQTARKFTLVNSSDGKSKIEAFLPQNPTGRAVVDLPGGGYQHLAMQHEGYDWVDYFNCQGIAYFVLTYRMPAGDRSIPLQDAYHAMKTVRDSAASWHINPLDVGIMGFSAGGHLASSVSTHADWSVRPNFSILFYPVVSMNEKDTHRGSVLNFLGEGRHDANLVKEWSNFNKVQRHLTPPAIILLASDDRAVPPVTNGVAYYSAMRKAGNDCSLFIYPNGGHGFGFRESFAYHEDMLRNLTSWLNHLPHPKADAQRVACIGNSITDGFGLDMSSQLGYPARLQQQLGDGYVVENFGVTSRTLLNKGNLPYMKEEAWHDVLAFNPNIAIIMLGTNDSKQQNWQYANEFRSDLQQMIDSLKNLPSRPRILLATPIPAHPSKVSASWGINDSIIANGIVPIIKKVAKKNKLQLVDMHSLFPNNDKQLMQADGIHPTEKGASVLANLFFEALKSE
jgi:acetyl esterase/lipase/lysophospholipase L1-like esterase